MTTDYDSVDYFTDPSLVPDPHPYFDHIRTKNPACCPINNGVLAVTGWEAANADYNDTESYSSCDAVAGSRLFSSLAVDSKPARAPQRFCSASVRDSPPPVARIPITTARATPTASRMIQPLLRIRRTLHAATVRLHRPERMND